MSSAYVFTTQQDPVERTVVGVKRVKIDDGFVIFRGRKKRTMLAVSESSLVAAWRVDAAAPIDAPGDAMVIDVIGRGVTLSGVESVEVERGDFDQSAYIVLAGDDDDLPIAVLNGGAAQTIAAVR